MRGDLFEHFACCSRSDINVRVFSALWATCGCNMVSGKTCGCNQKLFGFSGTKHSIIEMIMLIFHSSFSESTAFMTQNSGRRQWQAQLNRPNIRKCANFLSNSTEDELTLYMGRTIQHTSADGVRHRKLIGGEATREIRLQCSSVQNVAVLHSRPNTGTPVSEIVFGGALTSCLQVLLCIFRGIPGHFSLSAFLD